MTEGLRQTINENYQRQGKIRVLNSQIDFNRPLRTKLTVLRTDRDTNNLPRENILNEQTNRDAGNLPRETLPNKNAGNLPRETFLNRDARNLPRETLSDSERTNRDAGNLPRETLPDNGKTDRQVDEFLTEIRQRTDRKSNQPNKELMQKKTDIVIKFPHRKPKIGKRQLSTINLPQMEPEEKIEFLPAITSSPIKEPNEPTNRQRKAAKKIITFHHNLSFEYLS